MEYNKKVLQYFKNPKYVGCLDKYDSVVGTGVVGSPASGDIIKIQIKVNKNIIETVRFRAYGSVATIASASLVAEIIDGKSIEEALKIKYTYIVVKLNLPTIAIHNAMLAEDAIVAAIKNYTLS